MKRGLLVFVTLAVTASSFGLAEAGTIAVSNLAQTPFNWIQFSDTQYLADDFITGAETTFLESVTMSIAYGSSGQDVIISIYDEGVPYWPGSVVTNGVLSGPPRPATAGLYTYVATGEIILNPHTRYFVVAGMEPGSGTYAWDYGYGPSTSPFGWQMPAYSRWLDFSGNDMFNVVVTIPEPSALMLVGMACFFATVPAWYKLKVLPSARLDRYDGIPRASRVRVASGSECQTHL